MNQLINTQKIIYFGNLGGMLLLAAIIEFVLLDNMGGVFVGYKQFEFVFQNIMVMLTLGAIYLSLRLFKFHKVEALLHNRPLESYPKWSVIRLMVLMFPALLNIIGYWFFENPSFLYLWLLILLASPFLYPSKGKFCNETGYVEK